MKNLFLFFVAMFVMISAIIAQTSVWDGSHTSSIYGTEAKFDFCAPVTNAYAVIDNCKTAIITWSEVAGAKEYKVFRDGSVVGTVVYTEYVENADFEYGATYVWEIVTVCEDSQSNAVSVSATSDCCQSVTNVKLFFSSNCSQAIITWEDVMGSFYYNVYRDGEPVGWHVSANGFIDHGFFQGAYHTWTVTKDCESYGVSVTGYCDDPLVPAIVETNEATNITQTSATLNGYFDTGTSIITDKGFEYKSATESSYTQVLVNGDNLSYNLTGLTRGTTYQFRAFLITSIEGEIIYGETLSFFTVPFNQNGTAFLIENQADLILLANLVNGGNKYIGQEFILANDIDLPNTPNNILSIGTKTTNCPFSGIFNGNGKHIRNVYIDNPNTPYQGLFGYTKNAEIQKLGIEDITASGRDYTGGMVGYAENTKLDTLYVKGGTLHSLSYCGGLIGFQTAGTKSVITSCYNHGCTVKGNDYVGGLLGYSDEGTVRNSWVAANVDGKGYPVGAVIGGAWKVLYYNCWYNPDYQCPDVEIGENLFKSGSRGGMTSEQMRSPEFVKTLNEGLVTPAWKMDYNPPINNGFPILIWQTNLPPEEIEENRGNSMITIYPNPTSGELIIDCRDAINRVFTTDYHIFNMMGQTVMQGRLSDETTTINVESLPSGMYFLKIAGKAVKFVKQ